jgi:hypothetical protein
LERRRALLEALREAARVVGGLVRELEEIRGEVVGVVEEATGVALRPETRMLRGLYDFSPPPQPSLEELRVLVARSLGLDDPGGLEEWLRRGLGVGGSGAERGGGGGGEEAAGGGDEAGRGEGGEVPGEGG